MRIIVFILLFQVVLHGQQYDMKIIPFHITSANPNPTNLIEYQERLLISLIFPGNISTVLSTDLYGNDIDYIDIMNFDFSNAPFSIIDDNLYMYAKDRELKNDLRIKALDSDLDEVLSMEYQNNRDYAFPTGSIAINDNLYLSSISEYDDDDQQITNIKKVNSVGSLDWSKDFGLFDDWFYIYELEESKD